MDAPGQQRVFVDFKPAAREEGLTLGVDVPAPGDYQPQALPARRGLPRSTVTPSTSVVTWSRATRRG
ncbi:hypothetical protein [Dactylosporangium sp. NPDC049140]|uniref:hypothetical protein n=1 Tax=Dactylosporangium sp. NPDC049140 TaxID=3155647 RepID=UPI0033DC08C8